MGSEWEGRVRIKTFIILRKLEGVGVGGRCVVTPWRGGREEVTMWF
jgi:hypothetical protein